MCNNDPPPPFLPFPAVRTPQVDLKCVAPGGGELLRAALASTDLGGCEATLESALATVGVAVRVGISYTADCSNVAR